MQELASVAIGAEPCFMKLSASLSLEVRRQMSLLNEFVSPVSKAASLQEDTGSINLPVAAHLSLKLRLVLLYELVSGCGSLEVLLRTFYGGHLFKSGQSLSASAGIDQSYLFPRILAYLTVDLSIFLPRRVVFITRVSSRVCLICIQFV